MNSTYMLAATIFSDFHAFNTDVCYVWMCQGEAAGVATAVTHVVVPQFLKPLLGSPRHLIFTCLSSLYDNS